LFAKHVVECNPATGKGISLGHYSVQSRNYRIGCANTSKFYNQKDNGKNALAIGNRF
jgi:hypothetical protein